MAYIFILYVFICLFINLSESSCAKDCEQHHLVFYALNSS